MPPVSSPVSTHPRLPRFSVAWEQPGTAFRSSLDAVLHGPKPPAWTELPQYDPLRVTWIRGPLPARALTLSSLWHVAAIFVMSLPIWGMVQWNQPHPIAPEFHITYDLPLPELPPVSPPAATHNAAPAAKPSPPGKPNEPLPPEGADAFNPRQTILSQPQRVTHPRQTLIRPDMPAEPPKVVPQLPNIVEWGKATPAVPKLQISASALAPILRNVRHEADPAPDIRRQSRQGDPSNVAPGSNAIPDLKMPVNPASAPVLQARRAEEAAVPQIENSAPDSGALNIAPSANVVPSPKMPVSASSARIAPMPGMPSSDVGSAPSISNAAPANTATTLGIAHAGSGASQVRMPSAGSGGAGGGPVVRAQKTSGDAGTAPAIPGNDSGGDSSLRRLVSLSANPAPPSPNVEMPKGNLTARLSSGPGGTKPGVPGGAANGTPNGQGNNGGGMNATGGTGTPAGGTGSGSGAGGNGKAGPPGISITSNQPGATSPMGGAGGNGSLRPNLSLQPKPADPPVNPMKRKPTFGPGDFDTGLAPEKILGDKRIHTLYINLPNLTSASGSWVLNFAELQERNSASAPNNLSAPLAVRKVDPKYPTSLVTARVEGEVVLYAIIRSDGSVDSIQVLKSLDPELDRNAIEAFARWRFSPATRDGSPIDLEAVVHIPFRIPPDF